MCLDRNVDPLRLTVDGARAHPHHHAAGGALLGTRHRGPAVRVYRRQDEEVVVAPRRIRQQPRAAWRHRRGALQLHGDRAGAFEAVMSQRCGLALQTLSADPLHRGLVISEHVVVGGLVQIVVLAVAAVELLVVSEQCRRALPEALRGIVFHPCDGVAPGLACCFEVGPSLG